jgi:hypothetical protein
MAQYRLPLPRQPRLAIPCPEQHRDRHQAALGRARSCSPALTALVGQRHAETTAPFPQVLGLGARAYHPNNSSSAPLDAPRSRQLALQDQSLPCSSGQRLPAFDNFPGRSWSGRCQAQKPGDGRRKFRGAKSRGPLRIACWGFFRGPVPCYPQDRGPTDTRPRFGRELDGPPIGADDYRQQIIRQDRHFVERLRWRSCPARSRPAPCWAGTPCSTRREVAGRN